MSDIKRAPRTALSSRASKRPEEVRHVRRTHDVKHRHSGLLAATAFAQSALKPVTFSDTRLSNGLRVIISEDHYAPVFAIAVSYAVGSKDERPGGPGSHTSSST